MRPSPELQGQPTCRDCRVIDNEAIVVNLDSGIYSLRGSAAIWEMLAQQMAVPAVVQSLAQHYAIRRRPSNPA